MDPFLGEIRLFGGNFAPLNWAPCNGQALAIRDYTALFSVIGTTYGGDGTTTFCVPKLSGSVPVGMGQGPGLSNRALGATGGSVAVTLTLDEIAPHTHAANGAASNGTEESPSNAVWAQYNTSTRPALHAKVYGDTPDTALSPAALAVSGESQPHNNMQPFLSMNFIICLNGIFPSRQ
jgi:microcystin-dependent protein